MNWPLPCLLMVLGLMAVLTSGCKQVRTGLCDVDQDCDPGQCCDPSTFTCSNRCQAVVLATCTGVDLAEPAVTANTPPSMVLIPGGAFVTGAQLGQAGFDSAWPPRCVSVRSFFLDETEVTVGQFRDCVNKRDCKPPTSMSGCNYMMGGREDHPMNCIDQLSALNYCKKNGKRLPTEREWEYAARGSQASTYPFGETISDALLCWKKQETCPVGKFPMTLMGSIVKTNGLHDLAGNVSEWTDTCFGEFSPKDDIVVCSGPLLTIRGSSWMDQTPESARAFNRQAKSSDLTSAWLGFRCAQDAR